MDLGERLGEKFVENVGGNMIIDLPHILGGSVIVHLEVFLVFFSVKLDVLQSLLVQRYFVQPFRFLILQKLVFELNGSTLLNP